jgi:hypothetical protein
MRIGIRRTPSEPRSRYARPKEIVHVRARLRNFWDQIGDRADRVLIEQAANNLQSAPQHVHVTHLARLDMTEHSAISERSTGLHRYAKITPPTSSQDRDSKLWITQRGQLAGGSRTQSRRYDRQSGCQGDRLMARRTG